MASPVYYFKYLRRKSANLIQALPGHFIKGAAVILNSFYEARWFRQQKGKRDLKGKLEGPLSCPYVTKLLKEIWAHVKSMDLSTWLAIRHWVHPLASSEVALRNLCWHQGFPGGSDGKKIRLQCKRQGFNPWVRKSPWRRAWQPTPVFLPGGSHGQRRLEGYGSWGHTESEATEHACALARTHTHTQTHTHPPAPTVLVLCVGGGGYAFNRIPNAPGWSSGQL